MLTDWVTVSTRRLHNSTAKGNLIHVVAELPHCNSGAASVKANADLPDTVRFRHLYPTPPNEVDMLDRVWGSDVVD